MKIEKKVKLETNITQDVMCNKCGSSCKGEMGNFNGLIEVEISGAYDSTCLKDYTHYIFSLCEKCLVELFDTFKIPVQERNLYESLDSTKE